MLRVPPEDAFWKRYSPHSEFELSAAGSVALHVLAIAFVALIAWMAIKLGLGSESKPLPVDPVIFPGGGGGPPNARDEGGATRDAAPELSERDKPAADGKPEPKPSIERPPLTPDQVRELQIEFGEHRVQHPTEALDRMKSLSQEVRKVLRESVSPGRGGTGRDGGRDTGTDKGDDKGKEPGKGKPDPRIERMLRWAMTFDTKNGNDYARQLQGLDAILALPEGEKFRVIRDLKKRPARGEIEDVSKINRIYWVDDKDKSVASLAQEMEWPKGTSYFVAFFPEKLEKRLLELELEFVKKQYGKDVRETDIYQTKFRVVKSGDKYDVQVVYVELGGK
jgi:hypothetical protein